MTYRQRTNEVKSGLRVARKKLRALDTSIEKVQRELDRLIKRKTLVGPESMKNLGVYWDSGCRKLFPIAQQGIAEAISISVI